MRWIKILITRRSEMVKSIYLQDGEEIFVDDEDYERVSQYVWWKTFAGNTRIITSKDDRNEFVYLTPLIQRKSYQIVKNNDFTKKNLTNEGNAQRWRKANNKGSSKYKGVTWNKKSNKWRSNIQLGNKNKHLGYFANEDDAAKAYNQAVLDYWDGNGFMNIIGEDNKTLKRNYETKPNQVRSRKGASNYRGVTIKKRYNRISSQIQYKGKKFYIGYFKFTIQAALAYNKCAIYLHGDDAILNNVPMTDELKEFISNWEIPEKIKRLKED